MVVDYKNIADHYLKCLKSNTDLHKKVDWESYEKADCRYRLIAKNVSAGSSLLDFGCGLGMLRLAFDSPIDYTGLDITPEFIEEAKSYFKPEEGTFICQDLLKTPLDRSFDYIVCNGTFTEKRDLSYSDMDKFVFSCVSKLWHNTNKCLMFNFMDTHRIDKSIRYDFLYFVGYDELVDKYIKPLEVSKWAIKADYGTNDYMVCLYK